jgi:hypothetical protein
MNSFIGMFSAYICVAGKVTAGTDEYTHKSPTCGPFRSKGAGLEFPLNLIPQFRIKLFDVVQDPFEKHLHVR